MVKNIELKNIFEELSRVKSVVVMPHIRPDGDSVGAAGALCLALRDAGVDSWVYTTTPTPKFADFLNPSMFTDDFDRIHNPDICVAVDCSDSQRLDERYSIFESARCTYTIDHHIQKEGFGDFYYIDEREPAASSIVYKILVQAGCEISDEIAKYLYVGISMDTGNFQYSNTTSEVMRIAADLIETGIDHQEIIINIYQNHRIEELRCKSKAIEQMELFANGQIAISYLTNRDLKEINATLRDTDDVINALRDISGVEVAVFLSEAEGKTKASMRSKTKVDVSKICKDLGGGGHVRAAGAPMDMNIADAKATLSKLIEAAL